MINAKTLCFYDKTDGKIVEEVIWKSNKLIRVKKNKYKLFDPRELD